MEHSPHLVDTVVAPDPTKVSWINPRLRAGEMRKVVTGIPGKTGVVYTLDRATGEFLWATPTVAQNVISNIDGATGAVTENAELVFTREGAEVLVCPTFVTGGKDWEAGAYSPLTNLMYYPLRNACARMLATTTGGLTLYALAKRDQIAPGTDQVGTVQAISAETGEIVWQSAHSRGGHGVEVLVRIEAKDGLVHQAPPGGIGGLQYLTDAAVAIFDGPRELAVLKGGAHRLVLGQRHFSPEDRRFRAPADGGVEGAHEHVIGWAGVEVGGHDFSPSWSADPELSSSHGFRHDCLGFLSMK